MIEKLIMSIFVIALFSGVVFTYDYDDVQDIVDEFDANKSWEHIQNLQDLSNYFPNPLPLPGGDTMYVNPTRYDVAYECSLAAEYLQDILSDSLGYNNSSSSYTASTSLINCDSLWMSYKWGESCFCDDSTLGLANHRIVQATVKDSSASDWSYIVVAHYGTAISDNVYIACTNNPGAFDGASGVSSILEMARILINNIDEYNFKYTLKFILFPDHEGIQATHFWANWGSRWYVAHYIGSDDNPTAEQDTLIKGVMGVANMGILDSSNNECWDMLFYYHDDETLPFNKDLHNAWVMSVGKYSCIDSITSEEHTSNGDDSGPFMNNKGGNPPYWDEYKEYPASRGFDIYTDGHNVKDTYRDTLENISKPYFKAESKCALGALTTLSLGVNIPDQSISTTPLTSKYRGAGEWNDTLAVGDTIWYRTDIINHSEDTIEGDMWTIIKNSDNGDTTLAKVYYDRTLTEWEVKHSYLKEADDVPDSAGTYEFTTRIGDFNPNSPEQCIDSDNCIFYIVE